MKGKESALREHELLQSTNKNLKSKVSNLSIIFWHSLNLFSLKINANNVFVGGEVR